MLISIKNRKQRKARVLPENRAIKPKSRVLAGLRIIPFKQHSITQKQKP